MTEQSTLSSHLPKQSRSHLVRSRHGDERDLVFLEENNERPDPRVPELELHKTT